MRKSADQAKSTTEAETPTTDDTQQEKPKKQGEPIKVARAARELTTSESGGTARRAQLTGEMQGAVGNARVGQMLGKEKKPAAQPAQTIQRQPKTGAASKPPPITTPLPKEAKRKPSGEAVLQHQGVQVIFLPDKRSKKKIMINGEERDADTHVDMHWATPKNYQTMDGKITAFDPVPQPVMTIQTTYGPKASAGDKSAYGKGTTAEDIKAGKTTLGYHEGSHGQDFLQYVKDNPVPQFEGKVGMTEEEYRQAAAEYLAKMQAYYQALKDYSKQQTDCVGVKMDGCD